MGRVGFPVLLAVLGCLLLVAPARAATGGGVYDVTGVALAPSATETTMVGVGNGSAKALWHAVVEHSALADGGTVTGGSLVLAAAGDDSVTILRARFADGVIALVSEAPGCGTRVFSLTGSLADVTVNGEPTATGAGTYALEVTVRRAMLFGRCVVYARTVRGTLNLG